MMTAERWYALRVERLGTVLVGIQDALYDAGLVPDCYCCGECNCAYCSDGINGHNTTCCPQDGDCEMLWHRP